MTTARKSVVPASGAGVFHCISRCVRRAWLCGVDPLTGRDFSHRKQWVRDRLEELAGIFAVEVFAFAVMSNHLHVVLRMRPERAGAWSDREVVLRWRHLFPWQRDAMGRAVEPTEEHLRIWESDPEKVAQWRQRLGSVSWLMRCLNEPLARRANQEDECKGRFWEGRFKCQGLCDMGAVLACMAYVDLNPVRAGLAETPEKSEFTSVRERFAAEVARRAMVRTTEGISVHESQVSAGKAGEAAECGTCPHVSDRRDESNGPRDSVAMAAWLAPMEMIAVTEKPGQLGVTLAQYLELLEVTGRMIAAGKRGAIPAHLAPVVARLDLNVERWVETVTGYGGMFQRLAGKRGRLVERAKELGRKWFCRGAGAEDAYRMTGKAAT